jgi:molecular chaperone GrpE
MSETTDSATAEEVVDLQGTDEVQDDLTVLTADLQRLQAEYANYRKRVDRDRLLIQEMAIGAVLTELLPVLDDIARASEHGQLEGGFKAVADQITNTVAKLGLTTFGEAGSAFDPQIHEALMHDTSSEVAAPTASAILQPGYKFKDRVLRPARVSVTDPE